jgi:small subunit ribosomal protein SAe
LYLNKFLKVNKKRFKKMSGNCESMQLRSEDVVKFLVCLTHIGAKNVDTQMAQYTWARKKDGVYVINLKKTWEKLLLAARAIAAVENPADVCIISARPYGQRAVLKYAAHTGATSVAGRFTPGTFTNQIQKAFREPRLLVVCDPRIDHQAITEASYVNIPVIAFCNTDSPLRLVDIAIPCNNKGVKSVGLMWWMLAREVLIIRGQISRETGFTHLGKDVMVDLYFYRDPEETEKEEQIEKTKEPEISDDRWANTQLDMIPPTVDWTPDGQPATIPDYAGARLDKPINWAEEAEQDQQFNAPAPQIQQGVNEWGGSSNW